MNPFDRQHLPLAALTALAAVAITTATPRAQDPIYPGATWATATPESQGIDGQALATAIQNLPFPARLGPLMVVANGRIVHTVGDVGALNQPLFSVSKVVTFMLAARAVQLGRIADFDTPIPNNPVGAWSSYPGDATLRQFFTMTSDYGLPNYNPGSKYAYNNNAVDFLGEHLSQVHFGRTQPDQMDDVVMNELFSILGNQDGAVFDPQSGGRNQWGGWFGGLTLSVRDLGRLGYLLLRGGVWNGQRVLPAEFVDDLLAHQIPASASRYQSSISNENSQFNQQHVTDILDGNWSYGLWRAGAARADGTWIGAAAEGFRGKRMILMPRGTLPDPHLEAMLVCLPPLGDEGPTSAFYRDLVANAVIGHATHPEHDPRSGAALFDDGSLFPLEAQQGAPAVAGGGVILEGGDQRLVHREARLDDGHIVWSVQGGMPVGAWTGVVIRAQEATHDWNHAGGQQSLVRVRRDASLGLVGEILSPALGAPITLGTSGANPNGALTFYARFVGNAVQLRVNGGLLTPFNGQAGVPDPAGDGYLSLRAGGAWTGAQRLDYAIFRDHAGPVAQVSNDTEGNHVIAIVETSMLGTFQPLSWVQHFTPVTTPPFSMPLDAFPILVPYFWPNFIGFDNQHFALSSRNAPVILEAGTELVFEYKGRREGATLR